jgi:catechol 2,3-dioxygenase-like lactoylglutathione lyase family enzyme
MSIPGLHHIVLSVTDLERSRLFYGEVLGFALRRISPEFPDPVFAGSYFFYAGDVEIFLVSHALTAPRDRFSEFRVGLDHLSFRAPDEAALVALAEKLAQAGIENSGVKEFGSSGNRYVAFRDPDHIQLEYWLEARQTES